MNRCHRFKQADLTRAVKGATAAGLKVARVEIDADGKIVLVSSDAAPQGPASDFDAWKGKRDARST